MISSSFLVYESRHAAAYLNPRPVLPGHVLVFPKRSVAKFSDLQAEESLDVWQSIQKLSGWVKTHFDCPAFTLEFKDQVYDQVFFNLVPRKAGDLESNDLIYPLLERGVEGGALENEDLVQVASVLRERMMGVSN